MRPSRWSLQPASWSSRNVNVSGSLGPVDSRCTHVRDMVLRVMPREPFSRQWSSPVKKSMAKNVLQAVREDGASTLCELRGRGIEVLGLELTQGELISLVDYARRQGHLEP